MLSGLSSRSFVVSCTSTRNQEAHRADSLASEPLVEGFLRTLVFQLLRRLRLDNHKCRPSLGLISNWKMERGAHILSGQVCQDLKFSTKTLLVAMTMVLFVWFVLF